MTTVGSRRGKLHRHSAWPRRCIPVVGFLLLVAVLALPGSADAAFTGSTSTPANGFSAASSFLSYPSTIAGDHPSSDYRLDDDPFAAGTAADEAGGPPGVYDGMPYRFGVQGAVADGDTALAIDPSLNGNIGVYDANPVSDPEVFTEEIWFKTSTTSGGKLIGFGTQPTGWSGGYDRHIYMTDDGRLEFGLCCYGWPPSTLATSSSYNDGAWHQVAATLGPTGAVLYVDGVQQAADPSETSAQNMTGYWRIGGDNLGAWPDQPSSDWFTGELDEVSVYSTELPAARISAHYAARTGSGYSAAVLADSPYLFWRLGGAGNATVADAGPNNHPGHLVDWVTDPPGTTAGATGDGDGAASFDGRNSIGSTRTFDNPVRFSEECWFRTTTTTGGKLMGFGYRQTGQSNAYDRHVYMQDDGRLTYGANVTAGTTTITTASAYNDGAWHHVVATSGDVHGIRLYVDGVLQAEDSSAEGGEQHPDYFRVGGDNVGAWPNAPSSYFFTGSIDEVALYPYELSSASVAAHYAAAPSGYAAKVVADSPELYWRLGDPDFGRLVHDSSAQGDDGVVSGTYGFVRVDGPMRGGQTPTHAVHFDGQVGMWDPVAQTSPEVFSLEFWVRTTTLTGGKIIGFGDKTNGLSTADDRHVYMSDDGTLSFGVYNAGTVTITTPDAYNDGAWHHVVATFGSAGMRLYVDGRLRASNPGLTSATDYTGYWRVGGDGLVNWPGEPSDYFFQGDVAEVAVYPTQLSDVQVSRHYYADH